MTTKTYRLRASAIERHWRVLDASGRPLGRIASEAARLLLGKHKPDYEPHLAMGDHVIVVNAGEVALTGNKAESKVYYRHSGYPGNLRKRTFAQQMARDPRKVIETAVRGMLPHNARGRDLFRRLHVYAGPEHPHEAQVNAGTGARARKRAAALARAEAAPPAPDAIEPAADIEAIPPAEAAPEPPEPPDLAEAAEIEATTETPEPAAEPEPEAAIAEQKTADAEPAAEPEAASEAAADAGEAGARLDGTLMRYRRAELDAEAERLGIAIEAGWKKADVAQAVSDWYEAHPPGEEA